MIKNAPVEQKLKKRRSSRRNILESAEDTAEHNGSVEKFASTKDQGLVSHKNKSEKSTGSKKT